MHTRHPSFGRCDFDGQVRYEVPRRARQSRAGLIASISTITLLALWAIAATLYPLYRDQALRLLAERQVTITRSHYAHIVQLQAEIDRLRSLKLIEQERIERMVAELARRQTLLDARQTALSGLAMPKPRASGAEAVPETTGSVPAIPATAPKPSPLSDTILLAPPAERYARLESRPIAPIGPRFSLSEASIPLEVRLVNLARGFERQEALQNAAINRIEEHYDGFEGRLRYVLSDLGLKPPHLSEMRLARTPAIGGPFLPFLRASEDPFEQQLGRIRKTAAAMEDLKRGLANVPVRRPTAGGMDVSSGFGMRVDPFLRQLAMHTGVDFRGEPGDMVRAAAAGRVMQAGANGGYGLMVEIDHGNGMTTRYAHLSSLLVSEGVSVKADHPIGRIGSSGRSTGPHLHYEVRMGGEAVDPQKFLRAGMRLDSTL